MTVPSLDVSKQQATFQRTVRDTLVLSSASYALLDVERLDIYAGTKGHFWIGGGIGAVAGGVLGILVANNEDFLFEHGVGECSSGDFCVDDGVFVAVGAVGGFLLGGIVGTMIRTDKWEEVPLDRLQVSIAPTRNGFGLGARIAF